MAAIRTPLFVSLRRLRSRCRIWTVKRFLVYPKLRVQCAGLFPEKSDLFLREQILDQGLVRFPDAAHHLHGFDFGFVHWEVVCCRPCRGSETFCSIPGVAAPVAL